MALVALILGISGAIVAASMNILFPIGLALGVTAFVLGLIARRRPTRRTMAAWAIAMGLVAVGCGVYGGVQVNKAVNDLNNAGQSLNNYGTCIQNAQTPQEITACGNP